MLERRAVAGHTQACHELRGRVGQSLGAQQVRLARLLSQSLVEGLVLKQVSFNPLTPRTCYQRGDQIRIDEGLHNGGVRGWDHRSDQIHRQTYLLQALHHYVSQTGVLTCIALAVAAATVVRELRPYRLERHNREH